jgi:hypothetical protein
VINAIFPRLLLVAALAPLSSCIETAPVPVTEVRVAGGHGVRVGETLALQASTQEGQDTGYDWSVGDAQLADVDDNGLVTGLAAGETVVRVTGKDSGATGEHTLVVIAGPVLEPPPPPDPIDVPQAELWARSGHADANSRAFTHWDDDGQVPVSCARCHSTEGYRDFLGADGSAAGSVQSPAPTGSAIRCSACHNDAAEALTSVTFPSGKTVSGLGSEARCMVCHQGRASGQDVNTVIAAAEVTGPDATSPALTFTNIHFYPTAATLYAGRAEGGFQYEGNVYDARFRHVPGVDSCVGCHEPHSTQVRFNQCVSCHEGADDIQGVRDIRMIASFGQDYDGDGSTSEGIYYELETLGQKLLTAIKRYGSERDAWICYGGSNFPYWFSDTDRDGECSPEEAVFPNRYQAFTPRLLKATYNFQMATKDKGAFAHNAKYVIQLLHDSIVDMNDGLVTRIDTSALVRTDTGHFDGASRAARNWDANESVTASCSRCHGGAEGYRFFVEYGVPLEVSETANGLACATCHTNFDNYALLEVTRTHMPANRVLQLNTSDNLCANCHAGRASMASYDAAFSGSGPLRFQNVHYFPAAGTLYGKEAAVGYQYEGKDYDGKLQHAGGARCTTCHDAVASNHTFRIKDAWSARCNLCHGDESAADQVRIGRNVDYDGDGSTSESLKGELDGMAAKVLAALNTQAGLCYGMGHPYFFRDLDGSGPACSLSEIAFSNSFSAWTQAFLKAAHNYQLSQLDPGAWAHNFNYTGQLLYDSLEDLGGDASTMIRP